MWQYNSTSELYHYGIPGMKWGVRRARNKGSTRRKKSKPEFHEDYKKAHDKKKVQYMSDAELRERNNRLNAERQYQKYTKKKNIGSKVIGGMIAAGTTVGGLLTAYDNIKRANATMGNPAGKAAGKAASKVVNTMSDWVIPTGTALITRFD